jgi:hypothetical protein
MTEDPACTGGRNRSIATRRATCCPACRSIVGGAATLAGRMLVNKLQMATNAAGRMRTHGGPQPLAHNAPGLEVRASVQTDS